MHFDRLVELGKLVLLDENNGFFRGVRLLCVDSLESRTIILSSVHSICRGTNPRFGRETRSHKIMDDFSDLNSLS